jgi:hypothetical protein
MVQACSAERDSAIDMRMHALVADYEKDKNMTCLFEGLGINTDFDRVQSISGLSTCLMNNTGRKPSRKSSRVAFRSSNSVSTSDFKSFVAQWLACSHPCQRFERYLAVRHV